jgi:hypothetical protein
MGVFTNLNPLKKWIITNKYYIKSTETKDKKVGATHFLLDGGIWKVPKGEYLEFLRLLSVDLQNNEKHYICENRTEVFKFMCDLDFFDTEQNVPNIVEVVGIMNSVLETYLGEQKAIICSSDTKQVVLNETSYTKYGFHVVYPKIWITIKNAKTLRLLFIQKLTEHYGERESHNPWTDVVDLAVYEDNGLRMVGCRKMGICKMCKNKKDLRENCEKCQSVGKIDENRVYKPIYCLNANEEYEKSIKDYYVMLLETSIYNYNDFPETPYLQELPEITVEKQKKKKISVATTKEDELSLKIENFIKKNFKQTHSKIKIKKLTKSENCYYVEPDDNFCINVNRNHNSSGIYFQVKTSGVSQRCYCKKDTLDGRSSGVCRDFASTEVPLSRPLIKILFGDVPAEKKKKNIVNMKITKNQSQASLDLSVSKFDSYKENTHTDRNVCLRNCKVILEQIENELLHFKNQS